MIQFLIEKLKYPYVSSVDVDGMDRMTAHREILRKKKLLREVFSEFHKLFWNLKNEHFRGVGLEIEIGAGVAPMRDSYPTVVATDIVPAPGLDRTLNAQAMDLPSGSVLAFYCQNCFHHFPNPDLFFNEIERTLVTGGGAIILDPYYGPLSTLLYRRLFNSEGFDKSFPSWETPSSGPMNGANQALSYIVFVRDKQRFTATHPKLKIVHQMVAPNYLKYLLSGGLNFRQLAPDWSARIIDMIQILLTPVLRILGLHHIVVIKKISD